MSDPSDGVDTNNDAAAMEARLVAEICVRLVEWAEMRSVVRVDRWLTELLRLRTRCGIRGVMVYIEAQCGDAQRLAASYAEQVETSLISPGANNRQAVHKARAEAVAEIKMVNADLSTMLRELVAHRTLPSTPAPHTTPGIYTPAKNARSLGSSPD